MDTVKLLYDYQRHEWMALATIFDPQYLGRGGMRTIFVAYGKEYAACEQDARQWAARQQGAA